MTTVKDSIKLSKRLEMVASLVDKNCNCADIGADHGYLIASLLSNKIIKKGYACENKKGPYNRLKENIKQLNLSNDIITDLSDGISSLPGDFDTVIIAGMGGDTVCKIITDSLEKLANISVFIISSHSKMDEVRILLNKLGYIIKEEKAIFDVNQFYQVSKFIKGSIKYSEIEYKYGPKLLQQKDSNLLINLENKILFNNNLLNNSSLPTDRINQIKAENVELEEIIKLLK